MSTRKPLITTVAQLNSAIASVPSGVVARFPVAKRLFIEVRTGGSERRASWVMRYQHPTKLDANGKPVKASEGLGPYPQVSLQNAKKKAEERTVLIEGGVSPVQVRRDTAKAAGDAAKTLESKKLRTVAKAVELWDDETSKELTSAKYRAQRTRRLEDFTKLIGLIPIADLTAEHVAGAMTKIGRHKGDTLAKSSGDLGKVIAYAQSLGWTVTGNPVGVARAGLQKKAATGRRAFEQAELPNFVKDLRTYANEAVHGGRYPVAVKLVEMIMLTGARTGEIRLADWSEITDLDGGTPTLSVPASRMKMREPWRITLSSQAAAILREIKAQQIAYDLPGRGNVGPIFAHIGGRFGSATSPKVVSEAASIVVLKAIGWHGRLVGHGLRKVFSTAAHQGWTYHGANRAEAIEYALAHRASNKIRATYDKNEFMSERRMLAQWWADHIDGTQAGGNVVQFAARAA